MEVQIEFYTSHASCPKFDCVVDVLISEAYGELKERAKEVGLIINTLRTESFKLFKRPFLGFLTILTL